MLRYHCLLAGALTLTVATTGAFAQPLPAPPPATAPAQPTPPPSSTGAPAAQTAPGPSTSMADAWTSTAPQDPPRRARRPSVLRQRLRLLDTSLLSLADSSRSSRRTEGVLNLVIGAGAITIAALLDQGGAGGPEPFQVLLYSQGAWNAALGLTQLIFAPSRERLSEEYGRMPRGNAQERRERVRFGEQALEEMAADGQRRRLITAIASVTFGLGTLGIAYRDQIFDGAPMPEPALYSYLVIGSVGINVLVNLVGVISRSSDERTRDNYRRELQILRDNSEDQGDDDAPRAGGSNGERRRED